jgi:ABC-type nitrate/sulfonate/bicarbonate transport system permease component
VGRARIVVFNTFQGARSVDADLIHSGAVPRGRLRRGPRLPDHPVAGHNAADMMVALLTLGVIGIVMALGIKHVETRLLRWRPEYRKR